MTDAQYIELLEAIVFEGYVGSAHADFYDRATDERQRRDGAARAETAKDMLQTLGIKKAG